MQEQAINTFEDGLVMDLNPLTTPNNVLTNCLNGTYISFNGNEFVLQNDMGNGRVETAYLPAGYVPVGMKEYGGIIYVASYNPITNKGQIGSFPSPERNISSEEKGTTELSLTPESFGFIGEKDSTGKPIEDEFFNITSIIDEHKESIGTNTAYTKLAILDDTSILRPGDKFAIQFSVDNKDKLAKLSEWIENYYNNTGESNLRLLRIKIAISDSNGYLIDITKNLKRIAEGKVIWPVPRESGETEEQWKSRQYDGFFMQYTEKNSYTPPSLEDTRRAEKFLNVYNNKLAGTLFLVAELTTIDSYELQVKGVQTEYKEEGEIKHGAEIEFTTLYTSDILDTYKERENNPEDYWYGNKIDLSLEGTTLKDTISITGKGVEYGNGKKRNKGSQNMVLNLIQEDIDKSTGILTYTFLPSMKYGKLKSYEKSGFIDLSLLSSGKVSLNKWQYYTNLKEGYSTVRFGFAAYPAEGESVTKVTFTFYDIKNYVPGQTPVGIIKEIPNRTSWHGDFQETLYYGQELKPMTLYMVLISLYDSEGSREDWSTAKWLFTTELFNDSFNGDKETGLENGGLWDDFDTFNPYSEVELLTGLNISKDYPLSKSKTSSYVNKTSIVGKRDALLGFDYVENINYTWKCKPAISIKVKNNYPFTTSDSIDYSIKSSAYGDWVRGSEISIGIPKSIQSGSITSSISNNLLNITVPLYNNLSGIADKESTAKGAGYISYMSKDNLENSLGWPTTTNLYRLNSWVNEDGNFRFKVSTEWYELGVYKGVTSDSRHDGSRDMSRHTGWANEGFVNFMTSVNKIPGNITRGDMMIITMANVNSQDIYWGLLLKDIANNYILMNVRGGGLNTNGYSILSNLFGHILVYSNNLLGVKVHSITVPNYWKDYKYLWNLNLDLGITAPEDSTFFNINGLAFNQDLISAWIDSIELNEQMRIKINEKKNNICTTFTPLKTISYTVENIQENCPDISTIVNSYSNPQLDGIVIAQTLDEELHTEDIDGRPLSLRATYSYIKGGIYNTSKEYSFEGNDKLKYEISRLLVPRGDNMYKLALTNTINTNASEVPRFRSYVPKKNEIIWMPANRTYNTNWFNQLPLYNLDNRLTSFV